MNPFSLIIILAIIIGALLIFAPVSFRDIVASFPLFQGLSGASHNGTTVAPAKASMFRSIEGGKVWFPQVAIDANKSIPEVTILDFVYDREDSNILYAGTEGDGLYKSVNNGQNWSKLYDRNKVLADNAVIYKVRQDPKNVNNIYVAAFQNKYGVFLKSTDGGVSFVQTYISQLEGYPLLALAINPVSGNIIYIGTAQGGFFVSTDFGETWQAIKWLTGQIADIVINPKNTYEIYAVTSDRGLFRSTDGGYNWKEFSAELARISAFNNVVMFRMDPASQDRLYLAIANGLIKSEDRGRTWKFVNILIPPQLLPVDAVAIDPSNPRIMYVGVGALLYTSKDGGANWSVLKLDTLKRISIIAIDPKNPQSIFMGMKGAKK